MENDNKGKWELVGDLFAAVIAPLIIILCLFTCSCSPRIIDHYIVQRDTTYIEKVRVDSLYQHDSVYVKEKGDTLYIYKEKVRDRYRYVHDTAYVVKVDSVAVEREKIVEIEKPLSRWQSFKIGGFWYLLGALALCLVWIFRKSILKLIRL